MALAQNKHIDDEVETEDGKYCAYIFVNSVNNASNAVSA